MSTKLRIKYKAVVKELHEKVRMNFHRFGFLMPVVFLITYKGDVAILASNVDLNDPKQKDSYADAIRQVATQAKAVGVIFVSECWVKRLKVEDYDKNKAVRDYADKQECISIMEEYLDGRYTTLYEIVRNGKDVELKKGRTHKGETDGRMTNLLNKPSADKLLDELYLQREEG